MNATQQLTHYINANRSCTFVKFGDGEYFAISGARGTNCDGARYTPELRSGLIEAFRYLHRFEDVMVGQWKNPNIEACFNGLADQKVNWAPFHTLIVDETSFDNQDKLKLYTAIKQCRRTKIVVANPLLEKAALLLAADHHVEINIADWLEKEYSQVRDLVCELISADHRAMVVLMAGPGAKILLAELHKLYPNTIFLDIGSALDFLCTKKDTRGRPYFYEQLEEYFRPLLPTGWNAPKYKQMYSDAAAVLGKHVQRPVASN